jgi:hypothetical protein
MLDPRPPRLRVLYVEDNPTNLELVELIGGPRVTEGYSGYAGGRRACGGSCRGLPPQRKSKSQPASAWSTWVAYSRR